MEEILPDLVILDIMLPDQDGYEIMRKLRKNPLTAKIPVIIVTARTTEMDLVKSLDSGADDYLTKPFAFDELMARIRVMIRRASKAETNVLTLADLVVDCDARSVRRGSVPITLANKEFDMLEYMIRNSGKVLSREKIAQHIWNYDYEGGSNVVDVYIRYLRRKIDEGFELKLLHTVRGSGYVLREEV